MREILFAVGGQRGKQKLLQNFSIFQCPKKKSLWSTLTKTHNHEITLGRNKSLEKIKQVAVVVQ
jgi:hypothetical protein